jgi:predicted transcriptional regulator
MSRCTVPFKYKNHVSIYLEDELRKQVADIAVAEKKSLNKIINELIRTGLAKRQQEVFGLEHLTKAIKADLQLTRDEMKMRLDRVSSVLSKTGLHTMASRYQLTHMQAKMADKETARKIADQGWSYALQKLKSRGDEPDDREE